MTAIQCATITAAFVSGWDYAVASTIAAMAACLVLLLLALRRLTKERDQALVAVTVVNGLCDEARSDRNAAREACKVAQRERDEALARVAVLVCWGEADVDATRPDVMADLPTRKVAR